VGLRKHGPLKNVILPWNDAAPACFCEFYLARGKANSVDPGRAREGFEELYVYVRALMAGNPKPRTGFSLRSCAC
jgi:hypothetical protein